MYENDFIYLQHKWCGDMYISIYKNEIIHFAFLQDPYFMSEKREHHP